MRTWGRINAPEQDIEDVHGRTLPQTGRVLLTFWGLWGLWGLLVGRRKCA